MRVKSGHIGTMEKKIETTMVARKPKIPSLQDLSLTPPPNVPGGQPAQLSDSPVLSDAQRLSDRRGPGIRVLENQMEKTWKIGYGLFSWTPFW